MAILNQKRILNLIPKQSAPVTIHVSQGDSGETVEFTLIKGDEVFINPGNITASVHGVRKDNAIFGPYPCTLQGSNVSFNLRASMTAVQGPALAEITLVDNQGNTVGSSNFAIMIEDAVFPVGVTYDNDVSVYQAILSYIQSIATESSADLISEISARIIGDNNLNARIDNLVSGVTVDSEIQDVRLGADGVTYSSAGTSVRTQISNITNDILKTPYVNIFDKSKLIMNKAIGSSGAEVDSQNRAITDFMPVQINSNAYFVGKASYSSNLFGAYYDREKNRLGTFRMNTGVVPLNTKISNNCRYVRFTLNLAATPSELTTFKFYVKPYTEMKTSDYILSRSPNLLDHVNDTLNAYLDTNGNVVSDNSYYVTDYIPVTVGNIYKMICQTGDDGHYVNRTAGRICFYDGDKNFVSKVDLSTSVFEVTAPADVVFARLSTPNVTYNSERRSKYDMFGFITSMEKYRLYNWKFIDSGFVPNIKITGIVDPYVEMDRLGYWYFKFSKILYKDTDNTERELNWNDYMMTEFSSLLPTPPTGQTYHVDSLAGRDTMYLENDYSFYYKFINRTFTVGKTSEVTINDIILLQIKDYKAYGPIFENYMTEVNYYQFKPQYKSTNEDVLRAAEFTYKNTGILSSATKSNIFTFVHVSDNHHVGVYQGMQFNLTALIINHLHKWCKFDAILNTGDDVLTTTSDGRKWSDIHVSIANAINAYPVEDLVYAEGNHDRGGNHTGANHLPISEYYNMVIRNWKDNKNVNSTYPNSYYYRDYPDKKIRIICLTLYNVPEENYQIVAGEFGYDADQIDWLLSDALVVETGWSVIFLCHQTPVSQAEGNVANYPCGCNDKQMRSIVESFRNGTSVTVTSTSSSSNTDAKFIWTRTTHFDTQGPRNVIGFFGGHTHRDSKTTINNVTYRSISCGYIDVAIHSDNADLGIRNSGTISEVCFDIGRVDLSAKTVYLWRVGYKEPNQAQIQSWNYGN